MRAALVALGMEHWALSVVAGIGRGLKVRLSGWLAGDPSADT